jgi:hypothetical protein
VNSHQPSTSTTNTQWNPGQVVLTASIAGIALSAHILLHVSPVPSTVVAVAIVRPQAVLGVLYGVLVAVCGLLYIPMMAANPSDYFTRALANIVNGISGRELVPESALDASTQRSPATSQPSPEPREHTSALLLSPLPPATNAARRVEEHMYWQLVHERLPVSVPPKIRGRHAKTEARPEAGAAADHVGEHHSTIQAEQGSLEDQLAFADVA